MVRILMIVCCIAGLVGCSNLQKRAAEAEADVAEEKVKFMKQYRECLMEYEGQEDVSTKCAPYKEATEALIAK